MGMTKKDSWLKSVDAKLDYAEKSAEKAERERLSSMSAGEKKADALAKKAKAEAARKLRKNTKTAAAPIIIYK